MNSEQNETSSCKETETCWDGSIEQVQQDTTLLLIGDAKIMLVDDEPLNMEVLQIHLETEGYKNFIAQSDSTLALDQLRKELPDVLLLDLVMPKVTGYDILDLIRQDEKLRYLPVIVLTSANDGATKLKALKLGATDFLAKPIDSSELALRMRNTLTAIAWQKRMGEVDPLTELPNRFWFTEVLQNQIEWSKENDKSCEQLSALVLVGINSFKSINNSLGPAAGDEVLVSFSKRIIDCFRNGKYQSWLSKTRSPDQLPTVARLDGDRFAILLPLSKASGTEDALKSYTDSLTQALDQPFNVAGQSIYLSVSIGVSIVSGESETVKSLINNAETAMRHVRRRNDSAFAIYSDHMDAKAREMLSIENGLRTAVDNSEIFVVYQPKLNVATNSIIGAEALVRWNHPELGLVSPVNFISLAENSGMIVSIGEWVLRESCQQAKAWIDAGFESFKIAVNVSIRQLHEPDFIDTVQCALQDSELPPESLIIELTENMIMENAEANIVKLQKLKDLGIRLSIDDFGTGYSSLSYLQRFPIDQLKVDQSFIREIRSEIKPMPIVKAVISLAHDLGMSVVAEGVETRAQLLHIRALKCDEYQGYLCSKPVMSSVFLELLHDEIRKQA